MRIFWSMKSTRKTKLFYFSSRANDVRPYHTISKSRQQPKQEIKSFIRFFFCIYRRKRKSYQKENAEIRFRALRSTTTAVGGRHRLLKKAGENFIESRQKYYCKKSGRKKATDDRRFSLFLFFARFHYRQFFRFIGSRLCIFA